VEKQPNLVAIHKALTILRAVRDQETDQATSARREGRMVWS